MEMDKLQLTPTMEEIMRSDAFACYFARVCFLFMCKITPLHLDDVLLILHLRVKRIKFE